MNEYPASVSGGTEGLRYCKKYKEECSEPYYTEYLEALDKYPDYIDTDSRPCHEVCVEWGPAEELTGMARFMYFTEDTSTPILSAFMLKEKGNG